MPTCGSCKQQGQTIEHIRECYVAKRASVGTVDLPAVARSYVESKDFTPMAFIQSVPASKYALDTLDGVKFYEVRIGKPGTRWDGFRFVDHLVGAPGDWQRFSVRGESRTQILATIAQEAREAAVRFSKMFTVCAVCGSPLSDPESMARGLGPVCAERF